MIPAEFTPVQLSLSHEIEIRIKVRENWIKRLLNDLGLREPKDNVSVNIRPDKITYKSDPSFKKVSLEGIDMKFIGYPKGVCYVVPPVPSNFPKSK